MEINKENLKKFYDFLVKEKIINKNQLKDDLIETFIKENADIDFFFSSHIKEAILNLSSIDSELVFCGSTSLILQGLIKRKLNDLDVITNNFSYIAGDTEATIPHISISSSCNSTNYTNVLCAAINKKGGSICGKFKLKDEEIHYFGYTYNKAKVDIFHKKSKINYSEILFCGRKIKIENALDVIKAKKEMIDSNCCNADKMTKHLNDLEEIRKNLNF